MKTKALTPKQRLLYSIAGKETDRAAWSPFLTYYWENLPESIQQKGQLSYLQELGADPLLRGFCNLYTPKYHKCQIITDERKGKRAISYKTSIGALQEEYTYSKGANSWFLTKHPVHTKEDFKILQYIFENLQLKENYKVFHEMWLEVGEQGLLAPLFGIEKTPFQCLVEHWCGTIELTYALYDFPEIVEECLAAMERTAILAAELSAKTEAEAFLFWEDSSTTNISPEYFSKYTAPTIQKWGEIMHGNGKYLLHHACGHIRNLLPLMNLTPVDMIESISPPPTGNIDLDEAFALLDTEKGLIGGIEPTFFENCSMGELKERVDHLLSLAKNRRFILANSDSCPPAVSYEKLRAVSQMVEERG